MDCKAFTQKHAAFLDDTLPGVEMIGMRDHLHGCPKCSRRDAEVRRALLLVRNLTPIRVSEGFQDRLQSRLSSETMHPAPIAVAYSAGAFKWLAAATLVVTVGAYTLRPSPIAREVAIRLPAVIASTPPIAASEGDDSASAYLASMSTGIPMWPALMLAEEGSIRFAATELHSASLDARPR